MIHFDVMTGKGMGHNALMSGDRTAAERQTPLQHEELLDISSLPDYPAFLAMPPGPQKSLMYNALVAQAELRERENPRYWNDANPRKNITQSSSFIGNIDYEPDTNMAMVQMGNKVYPYAGIDPVKMAEWLNSPSMEDYYLRFLKR
jgi:hypothetical protein